MSHAAEKENRILAKSTLITSLGDFISLFAVLKWLMLQGFGAEIAGYSVVIKSIAVGAGAALLPSALSRVSTRTIMILSQAASTVISALLILAIYLKSQSYLIFFFIIFLQTLLKQLFDGARETHSKVASSDGHQMSFQAELLANFYSSQFIGPVVSFALIHFLPLEIPVIIDTLSFLIATLLLLRLKRSDLRIPEIHFLRPVSYLWTNPMLRDIFFLRSVVFWASIGLFNYLLFSVITTHYGYDIEYSAFIYSILGLGAALSSQTLRKMRTSQSLNEGVLAMIAQIAFAVGILAFKTLPHFGVAVFVLFFAGIAMGANTVATQTLRRRLTSNSQFPEIVAAEAIVGRATDGAISSMAKASLIASPLMLSSWLSLAAGILVVSGVFHLRFSQVPKKM